MAIRPKMHSTPTHPYHVPPEVRPSAAARGYDHNWRKIRADVLRHQPLCVQCLREGRTKPATDVDHIKAKKKGGEDDPANLNPLCHSCHSKKTARGG